MGDGGLGHNGIIGFAKEAAYGVFLPPTNFVEVESEGIALAIAEQIIQGVNGGRTPSRRVQLGKTVAGPIAWMVDPEDQIGELLKNVLSTEVFVDDGVGNGGQHTFTPGAQFGGSLAYRISRDLRAFEYNGGKVSTLAFTAAINDVLKATVEMSFQDRASVVVSDVPSYTDQNPLVYHAGSFTIDGTPTSIENFAVNISTGIKADRGQIGSQIIQEQCEGPFVVGGNITAYFKDMTLPDLYVAGAAAKIELIMTGALIGTTQRQLKITVPTGFLNGQDPQISSVNDEIKLTIPFSSVQTGSGVPDELIQIKLDNSRRSAY